MQEKRQVIECPRCGSHMVFTRKITPPVDGLAGLLYRCPTRNNGKAEGGCGYVKEILVLFSSLGQQEIFV